MIRIVDYEDWGGGPAPIAEHFETCWQDEHDSAENATASAYMMSMLDEISDESLTWIKRDEATLLVAIQQTDGSDGILVGTLVFITPSGIDSPQNDNQVGWFWGLYIHPDHRGMGIGSQLLSAMESRVSTGQCLCAIVDVNNEAVVRFYAGHHYHKRPLPPEWQEKMHENEVNMGTSFIMVGKVII